MRHSKYLMELYIVLLLSLCPLIRAQQCPNYDANTEGTIAFLRIARSDSGAQNNCVVAAIHKLYHVHSKEAIDVLTEYLDFKRELDGVSTGSNMEPYPAVSELFAIGKPALPVLIRAAGGSSFTKVAQNNALRTIMMIYRDDPPAGIRFLLDEAAHSENGDQGTLLRQGAASAVRWCQGQHRSKCESVLSSR
jgi:hypothetical protein